MSQINEGPFKRNQVKAYKNFSIHASWVGAALALIAITQVPIGTKATVEVFCMGQSLYSDSPNSGWCKNL